MIFIHYNDNRTIQIKQNYLMESKLNFSELNSLIFQYNSIIKYANIIDALNNFKL